MTSQIKLAEGKLKTLENDLKMTGKKSQESGINTLIRVAETMQSFSLIEFNIKDIVRSGFVKEYLIARINLNLD
jgi:phosphate starvation-inducible protein PhoH